MLAAMLLMAFTFAACGGDDDDEKGDGTPKFQNQTITVDGVSFKMIAVEGGTFLMGSPESDADTDDDEKPQHEVTLSNYYIGETEVTQELWETVMGSNPSEFKGPKLPVENVSWDDCQTFIGKLNAQTGKTFRLPTEAEWEYAARGGKKSKGYTYSGSNTIGNVAWYDGNSGGTTHEVSTKQANELGIYDMSGNVLEWCQDWYGATYYENSSTTAPQGPASGTYRVLRGGSWYYSA
ncbi:MAG: SUMF1/EgtB/PvdO family nonheme iron enzyme, partial [Bacteroidaceae bacterium]|nr:SUMF1/EgtB/PvdO family nonheme iron enzyme [Bacteroidaceae bacterium]